MKHYTEGEVLKALREKFTPRAGQKQTQIAAEMGFSVQYIQAVLAGSRNLTTELASAAGFLELPRAFAAKPKAGAK